MATRGIKPLPTVVRKLHGNASKTPINTEEPQPPALTWPAAVPPELGTDAVAIAEWSRLAPMLHAARQITEADKSVLIALCLEWSRYLEAKRCSYPRVLKNPSGRKVPNPWIAIMASSLKACLSLWPELGLTPSARTRIAKVQAPPLGGDSFSEFDQPTSGIQ